MVRHGLFAVDILAHIRDACRRRKKEQISGSEFLGIFFFVSYVGRWSSVVVFAQRIHKFCFVDVRKLLLGLARAVYTRTLPQSTSFAFRLRGTVRTNRHKYVAYSHSTHNEIISNKNLACNRWVMN